MEIERVLNNPTVLETNELDQVIQAVSPLGKEYGPARLCRLLAQYHSVPTAKVCQYTAISNISSIVRESINPRIAHLDLYVACEKPPAVIRNNWGQPTGQMLWSFFRDVAANEAVWWDDSHFEREIETIEAVLGPLDPKPDSLFLEGLEMAADLEEAS